MLVANSAISRQKSNITQTQSVGETDNEWVWINYNNNYYYYYRESTLHDIQYGLNSGHIVSELDPDAPSRQRRHLSELDEVEERDREMGERQFFNFIFRKMSHHLVSIFLSV